MTRHTIRRASPRKPDTGASQREKLKSGFGTFGTGTVGAFGSGGRFLGGKAAIASTTVASVTRKGDKIGVKLLPGIHMTMMMRGSICLIMINSRDVRRRWRYPTYHEKDEHELDTKQLWILSGSCTSLKGSSTKKISIA